MRLSFDSDMIPISLEREIGICAFNNQEFTVTLWYQGNLMDEKSEKGVPHLQQFGVHCDKEGPMTFFLMVKGENGSKDVLMEYDVSTAKILGGRRAEFLSFSEQFQVLQDFVIVRFADHSKMIPMGEIHIYNKPRSYFVNNAWLNLNKLVFRQSIITFIFEEQSEALPFIIFQSDRHYVFLIDKYLQGAFIYKKYEKKIPETIQRFPLKKDVENIRKVLWYPELNAISIYRPPMWQTLH